MSDTSLELAPDVLSRLHQLQNANRPVSVDEVLQAANLNHLALPVHQPTQSKSAETRTPKTLLTPKSTMSTKTLAERRRVPTSPEKLKLVASLSYPSRPPPSAEPSEHMEALEEENAKLPPQVKTKIEQYKI